MGERGHENGPGQVVSAFPLKRIVLVLPWAQKVACLSDHHSLARTGWLRAAIPIDLARLHKQVTPVPVSSSFEFSLKSPLMQYVPAFSVVTPLGGSFLQFRDHEVPKRMQMLRHN
jgi:hypothetical protein